MSIRALMILLGLLLSTGSAAQTVDLRLTELYSGLSQPLFVTHAGDGSGRLFIVEQSGRILVARNGVLQNEPFLDMQTLVSGASEQGLLGLAFAPDFASSGRFYVNYTNLAGGTIISRFTVNPSNPDRVELSAEQPLLAYAQPFTNHNGGWMGFGPDGYLYIASGDGGSGGDPQNHGQRLDTLLGKMLRIDVSGEQMAIPPDNPFVGQSGAQPEIWAYGLRNPWRASFDRETGDLWIADVGQGRVEEVNFQPGGIAGGRNYGWRVLEGTLCRDSGCSSAGTVLPVTEYGRDLGCSVTGGYVYRGSRYPALRGTYLFGDFCSGRVFGLRRVAAGETAASFEREQLASAQLPISSFGEDEEGNLYLVSYDGRVFLISDGEPSSGLMIDQRFTGTWFDPAQAGHGVFVEVLDGGQLVAYWFTFDSQGRQAWFGGVGTIEGDRVSMQALRAEGGRFPPAFDPGAVSYPVLGTLTLRFESCRRGVIEYQLGEGFGSGSMVLERLTEPLGAACDDGPSRAR
ncbi:PQQ-dependent sugar dehydrogenase [Pseudomarimonas salicorniae]|uniref:PQQ-dependent sugar dehydrogenase n=1 Tax=Pseudomarimonas salicorniae TaxID=2933270 RepID=A0ABT0GLH8_9GAMM|nr:PQQ-dependent sugar dehydrogenase [Lysobacter sp. CAU 1642]MCK7595360.1 PQQ-dependent sugar dehydrogenase [Lysobacter sp. CAU 1642]